MAIIAILPNSCSKDEPAPIIITDIELSDDELIFDFTGGIKSLRIVLMRDNNMVSGEWQLSGGEPWCTPSLTNGDTMWLSFEVEPYEGPNERKAFFTFSCGDIKKEFVICQREYSTIIEISPTETLADALWHLPLDSDDIRALKIIGKLSKDDFATLCEMKQLKNLDISEVDIAELPYRAFSYGINLEKLILPKTLTQIRNECFSGLRVKSITIPANVEDIESNELRHISSLENISFEQGSKLKTLRGGKDGGVFSGCNIVSIKIPASVETIKAGAFAGCRSLTTISFEKNSNLKDIRSEVAIDFGSATSDIIYYSYYGAFSDCSSLTSIEIPASVETIGDHAFLRCHSLAKVTFEKGSKLKEISGYGYYVEKRYPATHWHGVFSDCPITSIEIPASVESISACAFSPCSQLASVTFEKGSMLKTIGGKSVYGGVISGSKVYYYYYGGFASTALQLFVIDAETPPQCNNYAFYGVNSSAVLKVPSKSVIKYKMASEWKNFSSILGLDE